MTNEELEAVRKRCIPYLRGDELQAAMDCNLLIEEVYRLRGMIVNAPHEDLCDLQWLMPWRKCNCWKKDL